MTNYATNFVKLTAKTEDKKDIILSLVYYSLSTFTVLNFDTLTKPGQSLFSLSCHPLRELPQSLLREEKPTSAISTLYSTLLTSPQTGAACTAIKLTSSSQTSANTDDATFLEAASALFYASVFIFAKIAWNHCTKLLIGVTSAPITLLVSPPTVSWTCQYSLASLRVSVGTSFDVELAGNGFDVNFSLVI